MSIRGDGLLRQIYTVRCRDGRWQVVDGETILADCPDQNSASAAASRLARVAFNSGIPVKIDTQT